MNEEELKNKCKERAKIFQQAMESCKSSSPMDCIEWFADRIAELEKELEFEKSVNGEFTAIKKLRDLEEQIEKMKCCENCKHHYIALDDTTSCKLLDRLASSKPCDNWEIKEK